MNDLLDNHNILHGTGTELLRRQKDSGDCQAKEVACNHLRRYCRGAGVVSYCLDCGQYVPSPNLECGVRELFRHIFGGEQEEEEKHL